MKSGALRWVSFQFIRIYKSLIRRLLFLVVRKVIVPAQFVPWVRRHRAENGPFKVIYCHGGCIVQTRSSVYKVAFIHRSGLQEEARMGGLVIQSRPELRPFLIRSRFYSERYFACIAMPRCEIVGIEESVDYGLLIYEHMKSRDGHGKNQLVLAGDIELGLSIVSQVCAAKGFKHLSLLVEEYLTQKHYSIGVVHGDFHSRNILLDDYSQPKLIDLDCVKLRGIQELDAVHFVVEYVRSKTGQDWLTSIEHLVSGTGEVDLRRLSGLFCLMDEVGLYVVYMLNRLGLERRKYGMNYAAAIVKPVLDSILIHNRII